MSPAALVIWEEVEAARVAVFVRFLAIAMIEEYGQASSSFKLRLEGRGFLYVVKSWWESKYAENQAEDSLKQ